MKDSLACILSDETKQCPLQRGSVSKETVVLQQWESTTG